MVFISSFTLLQPVYGTLRRDRYLATVYDVIALESISLFWRKYLGAVFVFNLPNLPGFLESVSLALLNNSRFSFMKSYSCWLHSLWGGISDSEGCSGNTVTGWDVPEGKTVRGSGWGRCVQGEESVVGEGVVWAVAVEKSSGVSVTAEVVVSKGTTSKKITWLRNRK